MSLSPPARRDDYSVLRSVPTRWSDNDHYGHVNNVVFYSYFDSAVNGWLIESTGVDVRELKQIGLVVSSSCTYIRPISFPDQIEVGITAARIGTSIVTYRLAVFRSDDEDACAIGEFVHVYVDATNGRPTAIPAVVRNALEQLPRSVS